MELSESIVRDWLCLYTRDEDFFVVSVRVSGRDNLRVEVDRDGGITSDECGVLNRFLYDRMESAGLDAEIVVSSPGLTAPLRVYRQYRKNVGRRVEVVLAGGDRIEGELLSVSDGDFRVRYQVKERLEGEKRPRLVARERAFVYDEPIRVTLVLGKR